MKLAEASLGSDASTTETARCNLGTNYFFVGRTNEALPLLTEVLETPRPRLGREPGRPHPDADPHAARTGREPSPRIDAVLDRLRKATGGKGSDVMDVLDVAGTAYQDAGRFDQAVRYFEEYRKLATERRGETACRCSARSATSPPAVGRRVVPTTRGARTRRR